MPQANHTLNHSGVQSPVGFRDSILWYENGGKERGIPRLYKGLSWSCSCFFNNDPLLHLHPSVTPIFTQLVMDKLSGLASKLGGKSQSNQQGSSSGGGSNNQEDYVDKGLDSIEKKFGGDPSKLRDTNEKITDAGRQQFESRTGKHVPEKFSN
jgi:hypothetical protein